jgi:hypothetical protein
MKEKRDKELIEIAARWEAICDILDGVEVNDFMLSYPEVRRVLDLWLASKTNQRRKSKED